MKLINSKKVVTNIFLIMALAFSTQVLAKSPVYTSFFSSVAVSGYDTVAYFTESKPVKGDVQFATEYKDIEWQFSSQENLEKFKSNPEKYAPQYGGYCAWAVAHNDTAKGDPLQWTILNNKLYLNYDSNIQSKWLKDKESLITKANNYWPALIN